jgi:tight adherence protein B
MWAAAYGAGLLIAGLLLAASVSARERGMLRGRLGKVSRRQGALRAGLLRGDRPHLWGAAAALLVGLVALGPAGLLAGAGGVVAWRLVADARRKAREREQAERQLRDVVSALASATRAGLSARRALEEAAAHAEPPLTDALARAMERLELGEPLAVSLAELPNAIRVPEADLLAAVLAVHGRTGGNLPRLLEEISTLISQRVEARRRIRALTAQGRASGVVLAMLPVAFIGLLSGAGGSGLGDFYRTPSGGALLAAGLALDALGFLWMRRIVRVTA